MNTPVKDGSARGMIFAALMALVIFAANKSDWFTEADKDTLIPVVTFVAFFLGGVYDRYVRPKLRQ